MEEAASLERQSRIFKPTILLHNRSDDRAASSKANEGPALLPVWKRVPLNVQQLIPWLQVPQSHWNVPELTGTKSRGSCPLGCNQATCPDQGLTLAQHDSVEADAKRKELPQNYNCSQNDAVTGNKTNAISAQISKELTSTIDSRQTFDYDPFKMLRDSRTEACIRENVNTAPDFTDCINHKLFIHESRKQFDKKRYNCPFCTITCSNMGQLRGHLRCHTGERPFICSFSGCNSKFARNEELTRHKRIHSGVRPFACGSCKKSFGRKDHLQKHVKTHLNPNEKKTYVCSVCKQGYSRSDALARHKFTAHSDQSGKTKT